MKSPDAHSLFCVFHFPFLILHSPHTLAIPRSYAPTDDHGKEAAAKVQYGVRERIDEKGRSVRKLNWNGCRLDAALSVMGPLHLMPRFYRSV